MASILEQLMAPKAEQTREEFLDTYSPKHTSWGSRALEADIKAPNTAKICQGFVVETPRHNHFNWWMNRADKRCAELEARVAWLEKKLLGIEEG